MSRRQGKINPGNTILSTIAHYRKKFGFTAVLVSHDSQSFHLRPAHYLWEGKWSSGSEESTNCIIPDQEFLDLRGLRMNERASV
jgi:hypothetical protein